jgi:SAM-dependent MidA family methyltransferase
VGRGEAKGEARAPWLEELMSERGSIARAGSTSESRARLRGRIRARGPITFAEYMEAALYDPEGGFFTRAPVGREFVTSPHVSPLFGVLLTRQVREVAEILREPVTVVDLGAGDGILGRQLLALDAGIRYVAVERSEAARARLAAAGLDARETLPEGIVGCVIANELFDNVPFHLLRGRGDTTVEVFVGADANRLVEVEGPPTIEAPPLADGEERPFSPGAGALVAEIARSLVRGYLFVFDYGFVAGEPPEPVRTYRAHRAGLDPLRAPGETDITGPVDFEALAAAARAAGLSVHGPVAQRDALMALGYRELLGQMRGQQRDHEAKTDWRAAIATFSARGDASMLVAPDGLGAHKVLVAATEGLPPPRCVG